MDKAETYPIQVLARDVDNNPIQISVNGKIYESPDSGLFIVPLKEVEGVKLAVLDDLDITLMVAERVYENVIKAPTLGSLSLNPENTSTSEQMAGKCPQWMSLKHTFMP